MTELDLRAELARLERRIDRERRARHEAESLAEQGTRMLYQRQRELELLNVIADAANGAKSIPAAIQVTLDEVCAYTGWPVGHAYFLNDEQDLLLPGKVWHLDHPQKFNDFRRVTENTTFPRGVGLPGTVLERGTPVWIPDVAQEPNFPRARHSIDIGVVAAFAFPVLAGATVVAVLEFFSGERVEREDSWLKIAVQAGIQLGRIFERQRSANELEKAHKGLLDLSRHAGMAEVATGVLHNVGNVLNSVNVSATLIGDRLRASKIGNLRLATRMLVEQNGRLAEFLTSDPKGRILPEYLAKVAEQLERDQSDLAQEVASLAENLEHIKSIVAMQQQYARVSGVIESISPEELIDDALRMKAVSLVRHQIQIEREIEPDLPPVSVDRHKVLQILINLLRNSKQAMGERPQVKRLVVSAGLAGADRVQIRIADNGTGIAPSNMQRIFNHGFTTKPRGHGFGLHRSANAAKEMGGTLQAWSEGEGMGATFTLELPVAQPASKGTQP